MDSKNLATVFGVMAGIFANNSGELVQWLIENYFSLYEEEDLKHATTEPVFQRKMVGHVKSVLGALPLLLFLIYLYFIRTCETGRPPRLVVGFVRVHANPRRADLSARAPLLNGGAT